MVFGGSLASLTRWRRIDLDVAILLEPATLVGAVAGVLLNQLLPPRALLPALVCVLGVTSARTLQRGARLLRPPGAARLPLELSARQGGRRR